MNKIKQIQKDLLEVLKAFDKVCKKNGIKYSLGFGSLLGAIRHKGFIPWDDDVDIIMDKENYNKLLLYKKEFELEKVFFEKFAEEDSFNQIIFKVKSPNKNIVFDIFVLRDLSKNKFNKKLQITLSYLFVVFEYIQVSDFEKKKTSNKRKIIFSVLQIIQNIFRSINLSKYTYKLYILIFNSLMSKEKDFIVLGTQVTFITFSREDLYELKDMVYEDSKFPTMNNPEAFLIKQYGDYMKLPELKDRVSHHID